MDGRAAASRVRAAVEALDSSESALPPPPPPRPTLPREPLSDDESWGGALGVTGTSARAHEKGPGKWAEVDAEAAAARARARMREFDVAPPREVDLDGPPPSGAGRWMLLVGGLALLAILAALALR